MSLDVRSSTQKWILLPLTYEMEKRKQTADGDTESWSERVSGARPVAAE
jgi:hypothetical protein